MPAQSTYAYKARDARGQIVTGSLSAASAEEVGARLRSEGKYIISVRENALRAITELDATQVRRNEAAKRVKRDDVIALAQQLSVMLETGVPLSEALEAFRKQAGRKEFKQVLDSLSEEVHAGEPLSKSMAKWPRVFPPIMLSLMRASEASGTMALMLDRIGDYLSKERRTLKQIRQALAYPLFMVFSGLSLTIFLMAFVLPRFAKIYAQRSASLPTPTKILLGISDFVTGSYMYYVPVLIVLVVGTILGLRHRNGKRAVDWIKLRTPVIGPMFNNLYITRMSRTMATLLAAGVNLLDIIDICRGVTTNTYYLDLWNSMERGVRDGRQISEAVNESGLIPPNIASMIASGERSGRLSDVMGRIAQFSEEELDASVKQATSFIEPAMIIIMGVMIGAVAMALLLPIFSLGNIMSGGG
jgi:type IV pilus assembly protein PilC